MTVPADPADISILRTIAMATVGRTDVGVDTVTDAGLLIDEAAGLLLAVPGASSIQADLVVGDGVHIDLAVDTEAAIWPPETYEGSIGQTVLESLAARVAFADEPGSTLLSVAI